ncbi:hypothetical protein SLA2020_367440 [Shorea laevis]
MATAASLSSLHHLSSSFLSKTSLTVRPLRTLPRIITCSLSSSPSSSSSLKFNISFAPPKPKPKPNSPEPDPLPDADALPSGQLFIPWIVRGEDGNLKLQTHPPTLFQAARRFFNQNFKESGQRLSKVLAAAGVASRRNSEELIFEGKVTVNGSVCNAPQTQVDPARDIIYVNGNRLPKRQPPKVYFALNKPKGYICSSGEKESKSALGLFDDFLKDWGKGNPALPKPRLFTVCRLDVATTGLIIVTNDGDFAQSLSHPSSNLTKEYIAAIDGVVNKRHLIAIGEGTVIEGIHCTPDSVELLPRQLDLPRPRLRIVVHDGRKHEVRELVKSAGLKIHSLKRVRIGGYRLPSDLGLGKHVELKQSDLKLLGWKKSAA